MLSYSEKINERNLQFSEAFNDRENSEQILKYKSPIISSKIRRRRTPRKEVKPFKISISSNPTSNTSQKKVDDKKRSSLYENKFYFKRKKKNKNSSKTQKKILKKSANFLHDLKQTYDNIEDKVAEYGKKLRKKLDQDESNTKSYFEDKRKRIKFIHKQKLINFDSLKITEEKIIGESLYKKMKKLNKDLKKGMVKRKSLIKRKMSGIDVLSCFKKYSNLIKVHKFKFQKVSKLHFNWFKIGNQIDFISKKTFHIEEQ